jgi:hydroxypyruvate isomerase
MDRREFLSRAAGTASLSAVAVMPVAARQPQARITKANFKLKYAPHIGMFEQSAGKEVLDQLRFMGDAGFRAFEDNGMMQRAPDLQQRIGDLLATQNMTMGVFVIDAGENWKVSLASGKPEFRERFVGACRTAVDVAKRCHARWMTVVPGYFERTLPIGIQTGHVIDALRAGAEVLEPHGLTMVLEPLSDNPDLFLRTSDQAYAICRAVNSAACKILYDIYHMQRNEGHLIPHIEFAWSEIAYFQIGDVPGRKEPGTGEINYSNIFKFIHRRGQEAGREFVLGMEHGNSQPGAEGERRVIHAYIEADGFSTN